MKLAHFVSAALVIASIAPSARAKSGAPRLPQATAAEASGITVQKGKFRDLVNGKQVGSEEFEISRDGSGWIARGSSEVKQAHGGNAHVSSLLRLRENGAPIHYEWSVIGEKKAQATIDFDANGTATIHLEMNGGKPFTQQFFFKNPLVVILDDNLYHQYAILAGLYDWSNKGTQTFPVLIPQEMTPGTISVEALDPETVDGKQMERLRVRSADLEITLYLNGGRLQKVSVPSANAEIDRE